MTPCSVIRLAALLCMPCALAACGGGEHPAAAQGGNSRSASAPSTDDEKRLNIYSWADYVAPDTVASFEKETGIKVNYSTYDNNEVLETKLLTGHSNYDIVVPSENFFDRQLRAGVYRKLDKQLLPNLVNADPEIMRRMAIHDPGNQYAIPYMWSTMGLGYNVALVRARLGADVPQSWALLFDPRNAAKLADCGIALVDSPLDIFESAIIYLGRDPGRHDPEDLKAAGALLSKIRPFIRIINPFLISPLANGDVCLSLVWSGDVEVARQRAIEAAAGVHIEYFVPREGALMTLDMMGIPADAPHPHNAELWMNYLLRPEVMARITNFIRYPNGNAAALPLVDAAIRSDPAVYPDPATRARLRTNAAVSIEYSRQVTREWTRFRTGQ